MALTPRENAELVLHGESPEDYGDFMPVMGMVLDPIIKCEMIPHDGQLHQDGWGVTKKWPLSDAGMCPIITDENKVIKDICDWQDYVKFPQVHGLDWTNTLDMLKKIDTKQQYVGTIFSTGIYLRSTSGIFTEPSSLRLFSRKAISIRGGATTVLFRVCGK